MIDNIKKILSITNDQVFKHTNQYMNLNGSQKKRVINGLLKASGFSLLSQLSIPDLYKIKDCDNTEEDDEKEDEDIEDENEDEDEDEDIEKEDEDIEKEDEEDKTPKPRQFFECKKCNFQTNSKYTFDIHVETKKHKRDGLSKQLIPTYKFECKKCNFTTNSKYTFDIHIETKKHKKLNLGM
jgi:hypothetical protein